MKLYISDDWEKAIESKTFAVTDEWQKVEFVFTQQSTESFNGLMLAISSTDSNKNILVDNVSMTKLD